MEKFWVAPDSDYTAFVVILVVIAIITAGGISISAFRRRSPVLSLAAGLFLSFILAGFWVLTTNNARGADLTAWVDEQYGIELANGQATQLIYGSGVVVEYKGDSVTIDLEKANDDGERILTIAVPLDEYEAGKR